MTEEEIKKSFLKGYEEGLKEAWNEMVKLTTRGYTSRELGIMAKSKLAMIHRYLEGMEKKLEGFKILGEEVIATARKERPSQRGSYLVREQRAEEVFHLLRGLMEDGSKGMCITRTHPSDLREKYGLQNARFIWLTQAEKVPSGELAEIEEYASPTNLVKIASMIVEFLGKGKGSAILLEGLEYLITQNSFAQVLKFLQKVNERVVLTDSYLLVSANPAAMNPQDYKLLAKEMTQEI